MDASTESQLRAGLVQSKPIDLERIKDFSNVHTVNLFETERAATIYFGENTFVFYDSFYFWNWTKDNFVFASLLRKIQVNTRIDGSMTDLVRGLKNCRDLEEVDIGVDEAEIVYDMAQPSLGFQNVLMSPEDIDGQLNLLVLRQVGMDKLRKLRFPCVKFSKFFGRTDTAITGPTPGGVLETVVAREMMSQKGLLPRKRKFIQAANQQIAAANKVVRMATGRRQAVCSQTRETDFLRSSAPSPDPPATPPSQQPFRFLDLPSEIRNHVYDHVLLVDGKINPSKRLPSSQYRASSKNQDKHATADSPMSGLTILGTSKQVFEEAIGIYYAQNEFVFYHPNQLISFLFSISDARKKYINKVTLWYVHRESGTTDISIIDIALQHLKLLPQLKSLDLIIDSEWKYLTPGGPFKSEAPSAIWFPRVLMYT